MKNLSSCLWWLFNKDPGRLYLELQFFCAVANYGQVSHTSAYCIYEVLRVKKKYYVQLYLLHFVFFFPPGLFVLWDFWSGQTPNHLAF